MSTSSTPPSPDEMADRMAGLLSRLIGEAILFNERVARAIGLSAVDLQTFGVVARHGGPMTASEVARHAELPPSTTTRVLDRLVQGGYLARNGDPADRRKVVVAVVPAKAEEIARHYHGKVEQVRTLNAERTPAELTAVLSYLTDLAAPG